MIRPPFLKTVPLSLCSSYVLSRSNLKYLFIFILLQSYILACHTSLVVLTLGSVCVLRCKNFTDVGDGNVIAFVSLQKEKKKKTTTTKKKLIILQLTMIHPNLGCNVQSWTSCLSLCPFTWRIFISCYKVNHYSGLPCCKCNL